jgi:hypothetical protein
MTIKSTPNDLTFKHDASALVFEFTQPGLAQGMLKASCLSHGFMGSIVATLTLNDE